jgi:hypothetical protein
MGGSAASKPVSVTPKVIGIGGNHRTSTGGLPETHGGKFGQGARICDDCLDLCLDLWLDMLVEASSPEPGRVSWRPRRGPTRRSGTRSMPAFRFVVSVLVSLVRSFSTNQGRPQGRHDSTVIGAPAYPPTRASQSSSGTLRGPRWGPRPACMRVGSGQPRTTPPQVNSRAGWQRDHLDFRYT